MTLLKWLVACVAVAALTPHLALAQAEPDRAASDSPSAPARLSVEPSQTESVTPSNDTGLGRVSVLTALRDGNPMLWPLVACSVVAVGFALERFFALRRRRIAPPDFVDRFLDRLSAGKLDRERAAELCRAHDSPAARVFGYAVRYWGQPAATIRLAVDADAASEVADLKRNIRALNGAATLAPLLGLLGTVVGLIEAFDALGGQSATSSKGEALAHGIALALVATGFGLAIAVFSVAAYYVLQHRLDASLTHLDERTRQVIDLIASDSAWGGPEGRSRSALAGDHLRHETRTLGRSEPV